MLSSPPPAVAWLASVASVFLSVVIVVVAGRLRHKPAECPGEPVRPIIPVPAGPPSAPRLTPFTLHDFYTSALNLPDYMKSVKPSLDAHPSGTPVQFMHFSRANSTQVFSEFSQLLSTAPRSTSRVSGKVFRLLRSGSAGGLPKRPVSWAVASGSRASTPLVASAEAQKALHGSWLHLSG
eukprot:RCo000425